MDAGSGIFFCLPFCPDPRTAGGSRGGWLMATSPASSNHPIRTATAMFVDRVEIEVRGGDGGNGCVSFRREKFIPLGGPDGGNGGLGGSVIIEAREGVDSLNALTQKRHWRATGGVHGKGANRVGRRGEDCTIFVPPGTLVIDVAKGFVIRDLTRAGDQVVAAAGGQGGRGNINFKSSTNQAPRKFTLGEKGEQRRIVLELKMIADAGVVGKPNAGKSTLLSRLSRARPEIADYPFTTRHPNLGIVSLNPDRSFVLADIPGLIEGAHLGVGLGHDFLRHVERCSLLVHLVESMPVDGTDPVDNWRATRHELHEYDPNLALRPEILVLSKCELPDSDEVLARLREASGQDVLAVSAATGSGLTELVRRIVNVLDAEREKLPAP